MSLNLTLTVPSLNHTWYQANPSEKISPKYPLVVYDNAAYMAASIKCFMVANSKLYNSTVIYNAYFPTKDAYFSFKGNMVDKYGLGVTSHGDATVFFPKDQSPQGIDAEVLDGNLYPNNGPVTSVISFLVSKRDSKNQIIFRVEYTSQTVDVAEVKGKLSEYNGLLGQYGYDFYFGLRSLYPATQLIMPLKDEDRYSQLWEAIDDLIFNFNDRGFDETANMLRRSKTLGLDKFKEFGRKYGHLWSYLMNLGVQVPPSKWKELGEGNENAFESYHDLILKTERDVYNIN